MVKTKLTRSGSGEFDKTLYGFMICPNCKARLSTPLSNCMSCGYTEPTKLEEEL